METQKPDFVMQNSFSIILLYPQTEKAYNWIEENVFLEDWQTKSRIAIEPRYFDSIYEGITNDGLTIN